MHSSKTVSNLKLCEIEFLIYNWNTTLYHCHTTNLRLSTTLAVTQPYCLLRKFYRTGKIDMCSSIRTWASRTRNRHHRIPRNRPALNSIRARYHSQLATIKIQTTVKLILSFNVKFLNTFVLFMKTTKGSFIQLG